MRHLSASMRLLPSACLRARNAAARRVVAALGDGDAVQRSVELAVAAAVQALAILAP